MVGSSRKDVPSERIEQAIYLIRSEKVMLDQDLASLYGVTTKVLVQAVKRNSERFPPDFMFRLSNTEFANLKSQIVTSSWGGRRTAPYAFTEQGVAMLSGVLRSARAIAVNVEIMRTFVRLRRLLLSQDQLSRKLLALERRYDRQFKIVFDAIRQIMGARSASQDAADWVSLRGVVTQALPREVPFSTVSTIEGRRSARMPGCSAPAWSSAGRMKTMRFSLEAGSSL